ncbi:hypothetical protein [Amycolatopsis albispora]|uniref:Uncharacterized protein n=1 Tax=Amycolatopsis albispora TaxID=1804986 RepID=A0A344L2B8_9PSEU|nr:hypothetical protein [Amycolatopsis albispora]AXB42192.1 hypothetical protein A4R43_06300 [Amycolatopsis albispora]
MDATRGDNLGGGLVSLATRAEELTRCLYYRTVDPHGGPVVGDPGELGALLGHLRSLTDNIARTLPGLGGWLEERVLAGEVGGDHQYEALTQALVEITSALACARESAARLGRQLDLAESASRSLSA